MELSVSGMERDYALVKNSLVLSEKIYHFNESSIDKHEEAFYRDWTQRVINIEKK